ncbi:hypothetical protein HS088_TW06G00050 [Tripterygium wilfordii]|uniref:Seipin-1 n=1 Tax=Tripterygium wilfordii TaxID=458696 RepID=A0A7J7DHP6_TRIWF|nr:seipin-1 [Tripterygium wilfordii]KAF5745885.1 hypothetical protein HS088_TW06G00050 [Tripterygium wilfordii]
MEEDEYEDGKGYNYFIPNPSDDWLTKLISMEAYIIYNYFVLTLVSPITFIFSIASDSYRRAEEVTVKVESVVHKVPSKITHGSLLLVKKFWVGLFSAVHVGVVLVAVMAVGAVLGVGFVHVWVEESVVVRERLFFDYTQDNPTALYSFGCGGRSCNKQALRGIPFGHTIDVSVLLLIPESDYNRHIGFFQLTAELLSANGGVIARSSKPCMLPFRSLLVRLIRTFQMGIPLVLGLCDETQKLNIEMLKHKEGYPRTKAVRVILSSRAGTSHLPQLYEAKLALNSRLPWTKQMVHNWKWTLCVWTSLYIFITFLVFILYFCRPLIFPLTTTRTTATTRRDQIEQDSSAADEFKELQSLTVEESGFSELVRRWQQRRRRREAIFLQLGMPETEGSSATTDESSKRVLRTRAEEERSISKLVRRWRRIHIKRGAIGMPENEGSSASTMTVTREDSGVVVAKDIGDSESVCFSG